MSGEQERRRVSRRHPLQVTADRLGDHLYDTHLTESLNGYDLDLLNEARALLERLAEERGY